MELIDKECGFQRMSLLDLSSGGIIQYVPLKTMVVLTWSIYIVALIVGSPAIVHRIRT